MSRERAAQQSWIRLIACLLAVFVSGVWLLGAPASNAQSRSALLIEMTGPIGPAGARHLKNAIKAANERKAEAVILRLNTPGGLVTSMREIIADILASPVPVIAFVAPPGAHAASAGTYILYATHIAAMAPGTNLGAATPVQLGTPGLPGQTPGDDKKGDKKEQGPGAMDAKATNDAVAFIRSLAELRGRNAEWAEKAVREASSLSSSQALELRVIEVMADDIPGLLEKIDGQTVKIGAAERKLATRGLTVETFEPGLITQVLGVVSNPNVAFILMLIGVYGLIFELANPGSVGPGVIGSICLLVALYALNQLPLDYVGVALIMLGVGLMIAEAFTPTFGVFGAGGLIAFVIGAVMMVDTDVPAFQLSWPVIGATALASGAILILLLGYIWRAQRRLPVAGLDNLAGEAATVLDWSGSEGHVWARGERWQARATSQLKEGEAVRIESREGLTLRVHPDGLNKET